MSFRAILFDLDGTLVDSEREIADALAHALQEGQGVAITSDDRDFMIGRSWVLIDQHLRAQYPNLTWTREQLITATAEARDAIIESQGMRILPGAVTAVRAFADRARALVTGSSRVEAQQSLRALGLERDFDVIFAAEDVPTSKPSPDGYLAAMAALGVAPHESLVVEESEAGIAAGVAAGAVVVAVRVGNFSGQDQSAAHHTIDTLEALTPARVAAWFDAAPRA
ncbi:MAG: hypothetical protein Tsb0020_34910 [Haliangiales bacterium]